jgi:hypothetical protein
MTKSSLQSFGWINVFGKINLLKKRLFGTYFLKEHATEVNLHFLKSGSNYGFFDTHIYLQYLNNKKNWALFGDFLLFWSPNLISA